MPQENKDGAGTDAPAKELNKPADGAPAGEDTKGKDDKPAGDDETVTVKKSEFDKLKKEREDFEKATKIANDKLKDKKRSVATDSAKDSEPVLKGDLYKSNEKTAIKKATTVEKDDSAEVAAVKKDLDEHWDEIKEFYTGTSGREDPEAIVEDLFDAQLIWKRRKAKDDKSSGKDTAANLAQEKGKGGGTPKPGDERRKRILPTQTSPKDWYKKKE